MTTVLKLRSHATDVPIASLRLKAEQVVPLMRVLGNVDRLLLLCELAQGERGVTQLAERTLIEQPTLSQQLSVLRRRGLVSTRRKGKQIFYSVADRRVVQVLKALYRIYCR